MSTEDRMADLLVRLSRYRAIQAATPGRRSRRREVSILQAWPACERCACPAMTNKRCTECVSVGARVLVRLSAQGLGQRAMVDMLSVLHSALEPTHAAAGKVH